MAKRFGKYELVRSLGHGGMAEAWLAKARGAAGVTKPVVLKKVLPELAAQPELIESFIAEARISATLSHGNIAQVFEFGELAGEYFLAMEWVNGKSLAHVLDRAAKKGYWHLPIPVAVYIAAETLKGLHHAHTRKGDDGQPLHLVHRDVTPDNILLSFEGEVKVADFGIAKAKLAGRKETQVGVVKGKFLYFSPEQATGKKLDARADVYAVGACLYQMVTGQLAFEGPFMQVMPKLVANKYQPVRELNPEVPEALEAIIDRAMVKDLASRYRSAQQMLEALTSWLSENAPSFSADRLKLLLDFLYEDEHVAEGDARELDETERDQLAAWRPTGRPPKARSPDSTVAELEPVVDRGPSPSGNRTLKLAAIAMGTVLLVATLGLASVLLTTDPPAQPVEPVPVKTLPPPKPTPVVEAPTPPPQEPAPPPPDQSHRTLKLLADTHVVTRRPGSTHWKALDPGSTWRVSLITPGPLIANVVLEFDDVNGKQLVPIKSGETLQVRKKRSVGVTCEPGSRAVPEQVATLLLNGDTATQRLRIDPRQCADYEQAKRVELDHEKHYALSAPKKIDANLGEGVPLTIGWRVRLKDGAFSAGSLKPGGTASLSGALFLEVGFVDQAVSDNQGDAELTLDETAANDGLSGSGGTVAKVGKLKGPVMSYEESIALPVVQRARSLMQRGRFPEVLPLIASCFKEAKAVPECYRLEGEAYVRMDQRERAVVSYRTFLELAEEKHPARHSVTEFLKSQEP